MLPTPCPEEKTVLPCKLAVIVALAVAGSWAQGQTVYRCGSSYGQQPCAGGKAVETVDRPTAADTASARRASQADQKRADALEKERLAREKNAPKALVIGPKPSASVPAKPVVKTASRPPAVFKAQAPAPKTP
jgi:hypothetical protein